ncbi:MAG: chromosomal replication initiator protein DnaA [Chloroflexi bacterium]|nr:chromosomal replication initiator protein DnaA [Chloroflexota bacterium]
MNMPDAERIWHAALGELQLQLTKATFDTWLKNTFLYSYEDGTFIIGVPNAYAKDWLTNRLHTTIKRTLTAIVGHSVEIKFTVQPRRTSSGRKKAKGTSSPLLVEKETARSRPKSTSAPTALKPEYTFDSFIVGSSNRLAHAAALAVAERPAEAYNPLFIYGGVGLGKTHLLHAIGNAVLDRNLSPLYVSSERFTNDLINAIRTQTTEEFRAKYRNASLLLIDDIQFIAGKDATQEEFFHTFNSLHEANRQIVLSSDRPPKAIPTLEERLRSRFEWGLIADIQPPDFETRVAILRSKAEKHLVPVPESVLDLIARKIQGNIREMEGALNRVVAYGQMTSRPLDLQLAQEVLQDLVYHTENVTLSQIVDLVAEYYHVDTEELRGRRRDKGIVLPRQVAMYLAREIASASLPQIGEELGGRDHTTVLYGCEKISELVETDDQVRRDILTIRERLHNGHHNR